VPEGGELLFVCHRHVVRIIDHISVVLFFAVFLPAFFYYNDSFHLRSLVPFGYFEGYLAAVYAYLLYGVFDWYNDVWLITDHGIIDVDWNVFTTNQIHLDYRSIHGIEIRRDSIFDSLLGKGDIEIHLHGEEDDFRLEEAANPDGIVEYVQNVIDEFEHGNFEDEGDRKPFEILLETLTDMVREHLERKGEYMSESDRRAAEETVRKALRRKSTIDLSGEK
jgi:hypothetical protein